MRLHTLESAPTDNGYGLYGKPAAKVLQRFTRELEKREAK